MAYKICTQCKTQNGVRTFVYKQCGTAFEKVKKEVEEEKKVVVETPVETIVDVPDENLIVDEIDTKGIKKFEFKAGKQQEVLKVIPSKKPAYIRPDIEIPIIEAYLDKLGVYPVPSGEPVEKLTSREHAHLVLGWGRKRATGILKIATMEKRWKHVDWKYVAQELGETVSVEEPVKEEDQEEVKNEED